jgi:hypothetical protein
VVAHGLYAALTSVRLLGAGRVRTGERQPDEQLRPRQGWPTLGRRVECCGQVIGLGD